MKRILVVLLLFVGITYASVQEVYTSSGKPNSHKKAKKKKGYDPDRLILGGGLSGLGFNSGDIYAGVSLFTGYRITDKLLAGIGTGYQFSQQSVPDLLSPGQPYRRRSHLVTPNLWVRYFVYKSFFVSTTFEYNFINLGRQGLDNAGKTTTIRTNMNSTVVLVGCGTRMPLGGRVSAFGEVRLAVLQDPLELYPPLSPMLNFGFAAGL